MTLAIYAVMVILMNANTGDMLNENRHFKFATLN